MVDLAFIEQLNKQYASLSPIERLARLYSDFKTEEVLVTSSFGTTAVYLLHHIHLINPLQKVHFIDTGFHFRETIAYKKLIAEKLGLEVIDARPHPAQHQMTVDQRTWENNPDLCCTVNKVLPMQGLRASHNVWISGLIGEQTKHRSATDIFEWHDDILKFHPMIDQKLGNVKEYIDKYKLPTNPLLKKGYGSVGCFHCTQKGKGRSGRWKNQNKSECGLHLSNSATTDSPSFSMA